MRHPSPSGVRTAVLLLAAVLLLTAALLLAALSPVLLRGDEARAGTGSSKTTSSKRSAPDADFEWSWTIPRGKSIEIRGISGSIEVERAKGSETQVRAIKRARFSNPDDVKIEFAEHAGGVTVCAVYPSRRGETNRCAPGDEARLNNHRNDTEVKFFVEVPAGVAFVGRTVNGNIEAEGLESAVDAQTVNGSVRISTTGTAEAETVNGSITARIGDGRWSQAIGFQTVNGSITLEMPNRLDADLSASTVNGSISTDFPVTVRGKFGPRQVRGTIGDGGRILKLETVNGNIRLVSASGKDSKDS